MLAGARLIAQLLEQVLAVLESVRSAHAARDANAIIALYEADAVCYTLAPPLQQETGTEYGDAEGLRKWLATFDGPVRLEHRDPRVTASGDLALVHTLTQMIATPAGAPESFSFWYRSSRRRYLKAFDQTAVELKACQQWTN